MNLRIKFIFFSICFLFAVILARAFYLQLIPNQHIETWIEKQFHANVKVNPRRPTIIDEKGRDLAISIESYSLYADPTLIEKPRWVASRLASILGEPKAVLVKKLKQKEIRFVWIKRFLTKAQRDKILNLKLSEGLGFVVEYKRLYPNDNLLDVTLGRVGVDGNGLSGIELWLDQFIDQNSALHRVPKDAKGRPLAISEKLLHELLAEKEVQVTIDIDVQHFFEKRIKQARIEHEAKAAFAIVLELPSQEIRAIAYDSNLAEDKKKLKNPLLSNVYEFGSVLKPITIGAALEAKVIDPQWIAHLEGGIMSIGDRKIKESHYDPKFPDMNLTQIIAKSSNIGTAKVALKLGDERLFDALSKFNLNQKSGLGLPGESRGILSRPPWSKHLLANISFGQGIAITPIQLLQAWSALATDGMIRTPILIKQWKNSVTGEEVKFKTQDLQLALSQNVVNQLRPYLKAVTQPGGTGERAHIPGYEVAGKTGTAQKAFENGRGYKLGAYVTSFAGFFPAHRPKYVMIVALDEPKKDSYASQSAAPLFAELGAYLVRKQGIEPSDLRIWRDHLSNHIKIHKQLVTARKPSPQLVAGMPFEEALEFLKSYDVPIRVTGKGETVASVKAELDSASEEPKAITITLE